MWRILCNFAGVFLTVVSLCLGGGFTSRDEMMLLSVDYTDSLIPKTKPDAALILYPANAAYRPTPHSGQRLPVPCTWGCVKTLGGGAEGSIWFVGKAAKVSESAVYVLYMSISELEANAAYGPKTSSDTPPGRIRANDTFWDRLYLLPFIIITNDCSCSMTFL